MAIAAALGAAAVILGALGAHALRDSLTPEALDAFRTATHYQLVHAVALAGLAARAPSPPCLRRVADLWTAGVVLFSGSIYLLTCHPLLGLPKMKWWGPVTPLGGLLMILGWLALLVCALRGKTRA